VTDIGFIGLRRTGVRETRQFSGRKVMKPFSELNRTTVLVLYWGLFWRRWETAAWEKRLSGRCGMVLSTAGLLGNARMACLASPKWSAGGMLEQ
jgi:hypothetical protein